MSLPGVLSPSVANVMAAAVMWPLICLLVVAFRFYARKRQNAKLLIDDWLTIPAVVSDKFKSRRAMTR